MGNTSNKLTPPPPPPPPPEAGLAEWAALAVMAFLPALALLYMTMTSNKTAKLFLTSGSAAATAVAAGAQERVVKRVVFVRHGEGFHNDPTGGDSKEGLKIFDPELTPKGLGEASIVFTDVMANFKPTITFVSPLWRTLQTCTEAFRARADGYTCEIIAMEDVREHNNKNPCNHRRPISSEHSAAFPRVSFAKVDRVGPPPASEWSTESYKQSVMMVRTRAARVLTELASLPDTHIALFTHATFVRALKSEVLGLTPHAWGDAPHTGSPTEVLLIETASGERYWELAMKQSVQHIADGLVERIALA